MICALRGASLALLLLALLVFLPAEAFAQYGQVGGYDSGPQYAEATPANSSHSAGVSVGGLFQLPIARTNGGSGILTNLFYKSTGGSTGQLVVRIWSKSPANTTCTDNSAYAKTSELDDRYLIVPPFTMTPAAPAITTGDSATYAQLLGLTFDYLNADGTPFGGATSPATGQLKYVYLCAVTVTTDTADENAVVRWYASGPQN